MSRYKQNVVTSGVTRFEKSPVSDIEFSKMRSSAQRYTTFNAGRLVPVATFEVLPHSTFDISVADIIRQTTMRVPVFGDMIVDIYAFWVSNQTVNDSWKNVQGENTSGVWSAPEIELAPLVAGNDSRSSIQLKVGSVADCYGYPTQGAILTEVLKECHDLEFRGYIEIYNNYYRDQNYQPPIAYSKLNVYEGFFTPMSSYIGFEGDGPTAISPTQVADGGYAKGALAKALFGEGYTASEGPSQYLDVRVTNFSALDEPLRVNKFHDPFTSVLPSPQKGDDVVFGVGQVASVYTSINDNSGLGGVTAPLRFVKEDGTEIDLTGLTLGFGSNRNTMATEGSDLPLGTSVKPSNLVADLSQATGISVNDLRTALATQHVYEILARSGSRYQEVLRSMFGISTETPFTNMPIQLGHVRHKLDFYQVAQTSASIEGETPQGNLSAYGYTTNGGHLFHRTFLEHGYIHILACVRQSQNIYSTYLSPDKFRRRTLDFYMPPLANIGEQPIRLATLNPFVRGCMENVLGYQEAWWEYRMDLPTTSGYFRNGIDQSLSMWTYADEYDPNFTHVNGEWLKSNAQDVLDRSLFVTSDIAHQFYGLFTFTIEKQLPMPVFSVPGLDTV